MRRIISIKKKNLGKRKVSRSKQRRLNKSQKIKNSTTNEVPRDNKNIYSILLRFRKKKISLHDKAKRIVWLLTKHKAWDFQSWFWNDLWSNSSLFHFPIYELHLGLQAIVVLRRQFFHFPVLSRLEFRFRTSTLTKFSEQIFAFTEKWKIT